MVFVLVLVFAVSGMAYCAGVNDNMARELLKKEVSCKRIPHDR